MDKVFSSNSGSRGKKMPNLSRYRLPKRVKVTTFTLEDGSKVYIPLSNNAITNNDANTIYTCAF